ncbi:hypothetical protein I5X60_003533 [Salmonella enterica]|nr:hypothetical protein [Salmonella enterica]EHM5649159.1 phage GP46 family protein [Salmonella enterica subsp. enterica serovar Urbana]EBE2990833.1 hypothetical protein [Salmonella enterica]EDF4552358.1 hypothetical protein [Salmonella enterica]EEM5423512.1 hypothetical protein [Salmonella enterica]
MTDIAITWCNGEGALVIDGMDLLTDDSITTAVIISLFTDRRAEPSDDLPDNSGDPRGWWGDAFSDTPTGSRLWLLSREKTLADIPARAVQYAQGALMWLKEDGLVTRIRVAASCQNRDELHLVVTLTLPDGSTQPFTFKAKFDGV